MNLRVENINFRGTNEVIYGLNKAANEALNIAKNRKLSYGPRALNKSEAIQRGEGALYAYTDMLVNDAQFEDGIIKACKTPEIINKLKETLKPFPLSPEYAPDKKITPANFLINSIGSALEHSGKGISENVMNFFKRIEM